ncbi:MAG: choice-of-anchor D domain-containing protein, partial [Muribaculaceae bacterium]|nr:choice-of-anchor D domain-containing protein [Muribaculaceae bacterium]
MNKLLFTTVAAVGLSLGALSIASPNILKDVPTSDSVKSAMKKALNKDSRNPLERPLAKRTNAPRQVSNPLGPDAEEYLLVGYSMFDFSLPEEEQNVFGAGGKLCSYPVYISMDKDSGKVKAYNLINLSSDKEQIPAYGIFDKESNQIRFSTNPYFYETEETVVISQKGNEYIILQAGDPVGAGYWQDANELVINISNDGKVLTPITGFGAFSYTYDDYWEEFNQSALHDIMFNTHLYKKAEGVNILASENSVNLGQSFLGETKSAKVSIINTGNEESDFVVKLSGEGFSCNTKTGSLEPGASKELTIEFTPDLEGTFTGEIIVQNEGEDVRILLSGTGIKYPDFTRIVSKNADLISFSTSNAYPWIIREDIINGPVATTTNKGVDNSKSSLTLNIEIPEGKKGVLNWGGFYDPFYGTRDEFSITDNDIEIYCTPLKHQIGEVDGKINLLAGDHEVIFTYSKDMAVYPQGVEFGNDLVWLKNLSLDVETYTPQAASIENNEVDFNRFFLVTKEVAYEIEQPVLINEGYENLNILEIIPDGVFNAKADKNTLKPEERLKLRVSFNATSVGKHEGTVLIKTSAGDLPISCKLNVEEAPDYSSIIKEGEFLFVPDNQYPFTVEKGVAYNSTSMVEDSVETLSILTAFFNVPDDKYGKLTWMGKVDTQGNGYEVDKGMIMVDNNAYGMHYYHGHDDAGHYSVEPYEVYFNPGTHLISWAYQQCGDKKSYGLDRMSVSELSIEYLDKLPKLEVWEKLPIDMKDVYEGHKNTRSVNIANLSYNIASFRQSDGNDNFSLYVDEEMNSEIPAFGKGSIEIDFHPIEAGIISEELKLQ